MLNQLIVPEFAVAVKVTVPAPQRLAGVVFVITGISFTVATTALRADVQLELLA